MTQPAPGPARARSPRLPLWMRVTAQPELEDAWSTNVSLGGMALVASMPLPALGESSLLDLEFALPHSEFTLRARAEVRWIDERPVVPGASGNHRAALGVKFIQMSDADREVLTDYL